MKKYTMLSAVWLFACGAGAGQEPEDDSTLQSPLTANDDDAADQTEPPSASGRGTSGGAREPALSDAGDCDAPGGGAVPSETFPAQPGSAAPGTVPDLVIGAGGTAWAPAQNASVVWCNVDVPIGCPAISPAPEAGRLVVVHAMSEPGGAEFGDAEFANAGEPTLGAGDSFVVYASPVGGGTAPSEPVPVIIGGSLPPLSGTCVAVTFPTGGEPVVATPIAAGSPNAGGESASVPAGVAAPPSRPPAPASGTGAGVSGVGGTGAFPGTMPALPPPGECLGVTFPVTGPGRPAVPGQPVPDGSVAPVPALPTAGACVNVAFATSADSNEPTPSRGPVMCAFPVGSPVAGGAPVPSAGSEQTPDEDLR